MFMFAATFSAIERVALSLSENAGASLTLVTLMVTEMLSVSVPSEAVTDTE